MKYSAGGATLLAGLLFTFGCDQERTLQVQKAQLLEKPYPLGYPSAAPWPNRAVENLVDTRVCVLGESYGKDFHVFRVRTSSGSEGYILDTPSVNELAESCRLVTAPSK